MSQIELIKRLPEWEWMPKTSQEMLLTGQGLIDQTDLMWSIGNCAVVGFIYQSYLSPPLMWFALSAKVSFGDLVDFRRMAAQIPHGTITAVEEGFHTGIRFAKFYGFVETDMVQEYFGHNYKLFRRE